jgi:hypothetical protein
LAGVGCVARPRVASRVGDPDPSTDRRPGRTAPVGACLCARASASAGGRRTCRTRAGPPGRLARWYTHGCLTNSTGLEPGLTSANVRVQPRQQASSVPSRLSWRAGIRPWSARSGHMCTFMYLCMANADGGPSLMAARRGGRRRSCSGWPSCGRRHGHTGWHGRCPRPSGACLVAPPTRTHTLGLSAWMVVATGRRLARVHAEARRLRMRGGDDSAVAYVRTTLWGPPMAVMAHWRMPTSGSGIAPPSRPPWPYWTSCSQRPSAAAAAATSPSTKLGLSRSARPT